MITQSGYCPNCGKPRQGQLRFCGSCGYDYASYSGDDVSQVTAASPQAKHGPAGIAPASIAVIVGGVVVAIGSFLPWVTASTIFGSLSRSGMDGGDGVITLAAGSAIVLLGFVTLTRASRAANLLVAIAAAIAFLIFVIDFTDVQGRIGDLESEAEGMALGTVGIGLWLVALGAIVAFVASIMRRSWHKTSEPTATA